MNVGRTVFSQLTGFLPDREFRRCVARYDGEGSANRPESRRTGSEEQTSCDISQWTNWGALSALETVITGDVVQPHPTPLPDEHIVGSG
jgi:hypothetical protein